MSLRASCSKTLAKSALNAQLWLVPGAGQAHSYQTAPAQYQAKVLDFLSSNLWALPGSAKIMPRH
jgi:hypothetical protein